VSATNLAEKSSERPDGKCIDNSREWDADDYEHKVGDGELNHIQVDHGKVEHTEVTRTW